MYIIIIGHVVLRQEGLHNTEPLYINRHKTHQLFIYFHFQMKYILAIVILSKREVLLYNNYIIIKLFIIST